MLPRRHVAKAKGYNSMRTHSQRRAGLIFIDYGVKEISGKFKNCFIPIMLILILALAGCTQANTSAESSPVKDVIYETAFLDNDEITDLFTSVMGKIPPFDNVAKDYYVTTEFMLESAHPNWYGEQISIHPAHGQRGLAVRLEGCRPQLQHPDSDTRQCICVFSKCG